MTLVKSVSRAVLRLRFTHVLTYVLYLLSDVEAADKRGYTLGRRETFCFRTRCFIWILVADPSGPTILANRPALERRQRRGAA